MLKRSTILLMTGAIVLGGGVLLFESRQSALQSAAPNQGEASVLDAEGDGALIFPFEEGDVERMTLTRPDETLSFEKDDEGAWQMTQPEQSPAEEGAIAFLLNQLTSPTTRTLSVEPNKLPDFGLDSPDTTVTLTAADTDYAIAVGTADFTGDKVYVQLTEPAPEEAEVSATPEAVTIYVVSAGLNNAVARPTEEWLTAEAEPEADAPAPDLDSESPSDRDNSDINDSDSEDNDSSDG